MLTAKSRLKVSTMRLRLRPFTFFQRRNRFHSLGRSYALIGNPVQRLTAIHHDPHALAIGHGAGRAFAQTCPERSTAERFYRHCSNGETREAALARSPPCARHDSTLPKECVGSVEVVHRDRPRLQTNQRPASVVHQSGSLGSIAPAADTDVPRCSHKIHGLS